ncbi:MAG: hypothetical protein M1836_002016 [Candelina mexicana]|nr:MAG: hypothetical protein M1836_002016 [Candelina mexicana]
MVHLGRTVSSEVNRRRKLGPHKAQTKASKSTQDTLKSVANSGRTDLVLSDAPTVVELRRVRADYYSKPPEERKRSTTAGMVYVSEIRSTVARDGITSNIDERGELRERRHKHRTSRGHRSRKERRDDEVETPTYVYGNPNDEESSAAEEASSELLRPRKAAEVSSSQSRSKAPMARRSSSSEIMGSRSQRRSGQRRSSGGSYREAPLRHAVQSSGLTDFNTAAPLKRNKTRSNRYTATVEEIRAPKITRSSTTRDPPPSQASRPQLRRSNTTTRAHPLPSSPKPMRPSLPSKRPISYATPSTVNVTENKEATLAPSKPSPPRTGMFTPMSLLFGRKGSIGPVKK